jgi:hypothetical protein
MRYFPLNKFKTTSNIKEHLFEKNKKKKSGSEICYHKDLVSQNKFEEF